MRLNRVTLIFRKELRDVLRDRRTLVATFVLPVVLYPAFIIGFLQVMAVERGRLAQETYRVGVRGAEHAGDLLAADALRAAQLELVDDTAPDDAALLAGRLQLLVVVPVDFNLQVEGDTSARLTVQYDQSDVRSREALERFTRLVEEYREAVLERRLGRLDPPRTPAFVQPVRLNVANRAPQAQVLLSLAGGVLVFLAVTIALTGAFYPAVDACAGEKERGTIETLLVSPATRTEIVLGKYLLVLGMSLATAILNLLSMGLTIFAMVRFQGKVEGLPARFGFGQLAQTLPSMVWVFVLLIPVAALFSALALAVASFARSTKEAQYYMLPLYLLALPLAALGAVTGVEMNYLLDLVPVTGAAVVFRNLLSGREGTAPHAVVVFLANCAYAAVAIQWAASLFRREEVLFREAEEFEWRFWRWRSFRAVAGRPTVGHVILALGGAFLLAWYTSGPLASLFEPVPMTIVSLLVAVAGPPLAVAALFRLRWRETFRLRAPRPLALVMAVPLAGGAHVLLAEVMYLLRHHVPRPPGMEEMLQEMFAGPLGVFGVLLAVALVPALAEEVMFRGLVLSALRSRMGAAGAVLGSAVLFGVFHLNIYQFVFGCVMGVILAALALRSGSLLPAVVFHLTNNALGVLIMRAAAWPDWLRRAVVAPDGEHYAVWTVPAAAVVAAASLWLTWRTTAREGKP